jgi:hypothetical protein
MCCDDHTREQVKMALIELIASDEGKAIFRELLAEERGRKE